MTASKSGAWRITCFIRSTATCLSTSAMTPPRTCTAPSAVVLLSIRCGYSRCVSSANASGSPRGYFYKHDDVHGRQQDVSLCPKARIPPAAPPTARVNGNTPQSPTRCVAEGFPRPLPGSPAWNPAKQNPAVLSAGFLKFLWRRPTLPGTDVPSTIGSGGLNCRVRDGNGCTPSDIVTRKLLIVVFLCD